MTTRLLSWDWREQPDINDLKKIITELSGGSLHVEEIDTDSDEYAIAFSTEPLSKESAKEAYLSRWNET